MTLDEHGAQIVSFIERYQQEHGRSPTYQEIGSAVGIASKDHVSRDLKRLQQQGYLAITPRIGRSIVLLKNARRRRGPKGTAIPLPIVGAMRSRQPIPEPALQSPPLNWVTVGRELVGDEQDLYVLRVEGDAMVDALVNEGDLVVIRRRQEAQNGEMVAVWLKESCKLGLKYYFRENGHVRLQPANPELPPLHLHPSQLEIQGQVLAIMRKAS